MTDLDLDALEAVARAATPGPWEWEPPSDEQWPSGDEPLVTSNPGEDGYPDVVLSGWGYDASGTEASDEDRGHIATFDPPTVLALIARVKEAEREMHARELHHFEEEQKRAKAEARLRDAEAVVGRVAEVLAKWEAQQEHNRKILNSGALGHFQSIDCTGDLRAALKPSTENGRER
ncbi:ead/Ea22-like family protein [Microbacterium esteraromaticum]|uniref:ead/Ea22-like family protein n=1 Tax=Microbacterium esteraromaticum TaxID=57043 RepID=UPI0019D3BC3A|nr:ead/Ea22-like family protein [Microbacterium esteraromaticum]MBN7792416.1 ead/Ea22-like family protein [Microbacterium esteraromaticum]